MKAIRVQYTVKEDFVEKNKENIAAVMKELRETGNDAVKYMSFRHEDGKTFMHLVIYKDSSAESLPSSLDSFKVFQAELKENLEIPPKAEHFEVNNSSFDIF